MDEISRIINKLDIEMWEQGFRSDQASREATSAQHATERASAAAQLLARKGSRRTSPSNW